MATIQERLRMDATVAAYGGRGYGPVPEAVKKRKLEAADVIDALVDALAEMVKEYGIRDIETDELVPPDSQLPETDKAMRALSRARDS